MIRDLNDLGLPMTVAAVLGGFGWFVLGITFDLPGNHLLATARGILVGVVIGFVVCLWVGDVELQPLRVILAKVRYRRVVMRRMDEYLALGIEPEDALSRAYADQRQEADENLKALADT